ncbi:MAG: hypothetical protein JRM86_05605 [Nitrososphaerota archaeon]|nr:hypothetical protein [Nitrososphaerota archaeon]
MKLRTVTGNRYPARCACAARCGTDIPAGPEVKVVIDLDTSRPRLSYLPSHAPDAGTWKGNGSNGSAVPAPPTNGGNGHSSGFTPASALPASPLAPPAPLAPPKAPEPQAPPRAPVPTSLALLGAAGASEPSPSASAGAAWATSQLTFNAGPYESVKSGFADYCRPGETEAQLRARVNAVVLSDVEFHVRAIRELHTKLGDATTRTLSAPRPGAPSGAPAAASPPRMIVPSALPTHPAASPTLDGSSLGTRAPVLLPPPQDRGHSAPTAEGAGARPSPQGAPAGSGLSGAPAQIPPDARPLRDLVHDVRLDLSDADPLRLSRKEKVWTDWLQRRGYTSLQDVRVGDEWGLGKVLDEFEVINRRGGP